MTMIGGMFLAFSLVILLGKINVPVDPAWVTIIISGRPLLYLALTRLCFQRNISSALLISIAMIAAVAIGEVFATGEVFIMAIGAILEDKTVEKAKRGIKQLISLTPQQGRLILDGKAKLVPIEKIQRGAFLRILPGETVPIDGTIVSGNTSINQSVMTGESLPVDKTMGEDVFSGTINRFGGIEIKASKAGEYSSVVSFSAEYSADSLLQLTASVEALSEHPLGKAVVKEANGKAHTLLPVSHFRMVPGKGLSSDVKGKTVLCGSAVWLEENGVSINSEATISLEELRKQGEATIIVAVAGAYKGVVALSDTLKQATNGMVSQLKICIPMVCY